MRSVSASVLVLTGLALGGCGDPVREDTIDSLGPEAPGVAAGPLHRPNQPCVVCHGDDGPGNLAFSVAGTVYRYRDTTEPLANAIVRVVDSKGQKSFTGTNCAGNFFFQKSDYDPTFPVWVSLEFGGVPSDMSTPIFRDGSCAKCHSDPAGESSVGHAYFVESGIELPGSNCE